MKKYWNINDINHKNFILELYPADTNFLMRLKVSIAYLFKIKSKCDDIYWKAKLK